jgi:hypothetical protein
LRDAIVSSGGGAFISSCVFARKGAFSSIAWDGVGTAMRFYVGLRLGVIGGRWSGR